MNRTILATGLVAGLLAASPARAQTAVDPSNPNAGDVVTKPLEDMNLKKDEIPPILLQVRDKPYDMTGLRRCQDIQANIQNLDAVLGDDIDIAAADKRGMSVGRIAQSIVGSLIPFGGVIREISGANENRRQWELAIYAGSVRRAFLKGVGQSRGCAYPARPASARDVALVKAAREKADQDEKKEDKAEPDAAQKAGAVRYESRPVVQGGKSR